MADWQLKVKNFFASKPYPSSDLTEECIAVPDAIFESLQLQLKAEDTGKRDLPASDSSTPDGTEREIQNYFENRMAVINKIANEGLSRRNTSISDTHLEDEKAGIKNHTQYSKLEIESLMTREFRDLMSLKKERDALDSEFQSFREKNRLTRIPHYPDSQLLNFAIILIFWLIESIGNGYFFAEGSELGLLGGVAQAVIIAAINIATAFFIMGSIIRYKNHTFWLKRLMAYLAIAVYFCAAISFNLMVAHYRDLFAVNANSAGHQALIQFQQNPLELADINSWMLFLMGLLFSIFSLIDGYKRDDSYPGYGKLHRRVNELYELYEEHRDEVVAQIEEIRNEFLDKLQLMKQAVAMKHTRLVHLVEEKQAFISEYEHGIANFIKAANALIFRYRDINMANRKSNAPAYFKTEWRTERKFQLRGSHDDIQRVEEQQELYKNFPKFCQQRANEIEHLYVDFFDKLKQLDPDFKVKQPTEAIPITA